MFCPARPYYEQKGFSRKPAELAAASVRLPPVPARCAATEDRILMKQMQNFPLETRGDTVSRDALVQAALQEITQNYREASLSNVARTYGDSLA